MPKMSGLLYEARRKFEQRKYKVGDGTEQECWRCPVRDLLPVDGKRFEKDYMLFSKSVRLRLCAHTC
jgi:hypothetical protein